MSGEEERNALVRSCRKCGVVTNVDLEGTPERWHEMQKAGQVVERVTGEEAMRRWREKGGRCNCGVQAGLELWGAR